MDSTQHPYVKGRSVYIFTPRGLEAPAPVVFFCHGIGAGDPESYGALITHIVGRGFAVVYSPFDRGEAMLRPVKTYREMWDGFDKAAAVWDAYIDKSRIGFVGHSFGGGAVPYMAYCAHVERHWGRQGTFLFVMAPWYAQGMSQAHLKTGFKRCSMIMQVYEEDDINDPRIARDIFRSIGIEPAHKRFVTVHSGASAAGRLAASHDVPMGTDADDSCVNMLDSAAIYRPFDSLAAATFHRALPGATIAGSRQSWSHRRHVVIDARRS